MGSYVVIPQASGGSETPPTSRGISPPSPVPIQGDCYIPKNSSFTGGASRYGALVISEGSDGGSFGPSPARALRDIVHPPLLLLRSGAYYSRSIYYDPLSHLRAPDGGSDGLGLAYNTQCSMVALCL